MLNLAVMEWECRATKSGFQDQEGNNTRKTDAEEVVVKSWLEFLKKQPTD